jgi:hypothetical protein
VQCAATRRYTRIYLHVHLTCQANHPEERSHGVSQRLGDSCTESCCMLSGRTLYRTPSLSRSEDYILVLNALASHVRHIIEGSIVLRSSMMWHTWLASAFRTSMKSSEKAEGRHIRDDDLQCAQRSNSPLGYLSAPHLKHSTRDAKLSKPHCPHCHSPGRSERPRRLGSTRLQQSPLHRCEKAGRAEDARRKEEKALLLFVVTWAGSGGPATRGRGCFAAATWWSRRAVWAPGAPTDSPCTRSVSRS